MTDHRLTVPYCIFQYEEETVRFTFRLLASYEYEGRPPVIFNCIKFSVTKLQRKT